MIVIDDTSWGLSKAWSVTYYRNHSFIVLATVITIVNYERKTFIVQATDDVGMSEARKLKSIIKIDNPSAVLSLL